MQQGLEPVATPIDGVMEQELEQLEKIYTLITEFFVNYSFQLVGALIILLVGLLIASRTGKVVERFCRKHNLDITLSRFIGSCAKIAIIVGVAIICLNKLGISITPFVAAIGAISLGAGLAVQGLLSNFGAGLNIIIARPFVIGDTISVQGVTGLVDEVHLAYTILRDEDDVKITIPNRHIIGEIIHNSKAYKLAETTVGVAYDTDIDLALQTVRSVCDGMKLGEHQPPQIGIDEFGDSSINIGVRYWLPTDRYHELRFDFNGRVWRAIGEAGIHIPFPQREVRLLGESRQKG